MSSSHHRNIRHQIFYFANCNALYYNGRNGYSIFLCVYRLRQQTMMINIDTVWQHCHSVMAEKKKKKKKEIKEGLYVGHCKGWKKTALVTSLPGRGNHVVYRYLYLSSSASRINKQFHICRSIIHSIFLFHLRDERWHIGNPPQCTQAHRWENLSPFTHATHTHTHTHAQLEKGAAAAALKYWFSFDSLYIFIRCV